MRVKCSGCEHEITSLEFEKLEATEGQGVALNPNAPKPLRAVAYVCPRCRVILGVGVDQKA